MQHHPHRRICEARVREARHLQKRNGDDRVWALLSLQGQHHQEACKDLDSPSWHRVAVFDINLLEAADGAGQEEAPAGYSSTSTGSGSTSSTSSTSTSSTIAAGNTGSGGGDRELASFSTATFERLPTQPPKNRARAASSSSGVAVRPSSPSRNPFAVTPSSAATITETQSLNPFASNFVPPPSSLPTSPPSPSPPAPAPPPPHPLPPGAGAEPGPTPGGAAASAAVPYRKSLVLHLRVLTGRLRSKEVLGDVALDLVPLLRSDGELLAADRLRWLTSEDEEAVEKKTAPGGGGGVVGGGQQPSTIAVDTWVSLRQATAELRVQLLIKPGRSFPGAAAAAAGAAGARRYTSGRGDAWSAAFESMAERGLVKTSLGLEQRPLDERLLAIQELYDFSAAGGGYRTGKPDGDDGDGGVEGGGGGGDKATKIAQWPASGREASQLRRDMQLAALRDRHQSVAWAEKLASSAALQQALRCPPAIGGRTRGEVAAAAAIPAFRHLKNLIAEGIPAALQEQPPEDGGAGAGAGGVAASRGLDSGAFMMGGEAEEEESSFLDGVVTAIPRVELVRVSGTICCAEYHLQVTREPRGARAGDSWCVLRRYSDFFQLYEHLPRDLHAPMPPKSWRSFSFLSMTPEFLEERRVALEVALRRLTINAVRSDAAVQADLREFLGFPPLRGGGRGGLSGGGGEAAAAAGGGARLAGVGAGVARHLARVPADLELVLPAGALAAPLPLLGNLRVVMWMLLSGAAHKVSVSDDRQQYRSLVAASEEAAAEESGWQGLGGDSSSPAKGDDRAAAAAVAFETIRADVNRTNVSSSAERERMRRVLRAFALKEPGTGYCQGMNSVALFLLRTAGGREDVAFWLLDALATAVIPGHWEQLSHIATAGVGVVTTRLLLEDRAPHLLDHLDRNLPPEVLLCDFMLSLGCRSLPPTTLLRCFDLLFLEGGDALVYITFAMLRLAEEQLLGVQGAPAVSETLARCTAAMQDADLLVETARSEMEKGLQAVVKAGADRPPF